MLVSILSIYLISVLFSVQAADDEQGELSQPLLQLTLDESPAGFMRRLHAIEAKFEHDLPTKFTFEQWKKADVNEALLNIKTFMQKCSCADYYEYIVELASSKKLTDKDKLQEQFVMIPYFQELAKQSQEERQRIADIGFGIDHDYNYPARRLLFAALARLKINVKSRSFEIVLLKDDTAVLSILLQQSANPNVYNTLEDCKSLHAVQILLDYKVDFQEQHKKSDLIADRMYRDGKKSSRILAFFLSQVDLNESNQFGKKWFDILARDEWACNFDALSEKMMLLLKYGCHCDALYKQQILNKIESICYVSVPGSEKLTKKQKESERRRIKMAAKHNTEKLFKEYGDGRKNIIVGLRQRAITGKSLRQLRTNLHAPYERLIEEDNKKKAKELGPVEIFPIVELFQEMPSLLRRPYNGHHW